jgi:hypothetical protein
MKQALNRAVLAAALALGLAAPAAAQPAAPAADSSAAVVEPYRREVFRYQRGGRPDPFQPLLSAADLGYRVEDIRLTSIVYSPDPRQSIAVFAMADSSARHRLRTGQRLGSITVVGIYPRRVDVQVNDFGTMRVQSLTLQRAVRAPAPGPGAAGATAGAGQPGQPQPVIIQAPAPAAPAAPSGPLRRGGQPRREGQPGATQPAPQQNQTSRSPGAATGQRTGAQSQQRYR